MKKYQFAIITCCVLSLGFSACTEKNSAEEEKDNKRADNMLTTFFSRNSDETAGAKTRTSLDYASEKWFWEAGDKIYAKDREGNWQASTVVDGHKDEFAFQLPGMYSPTGTVVYYPGKNGSNDQVTIPATQQQKQPNTTDALQNYGECGMATAVPDWKPDGLAFTFQLKHQAAVLAIQPYTVNSTIQNCKLTKIEVSSDNDIAGTFTLSPIGLTGSGSKTITLETKSDASGSYPDGFPLTNTTVSLATNGSYMVIKPGTHALTMRYWLKNIATNEVSTVVKTYAPFNYAANNYYDMAANLSIKEYSSEEFYMWDATENYNYWKGYESEQQFLGLSEYLGQTPSTHYAQNNSDQRWFHEGGATSPITATASCKDCLNANELFWYVFRGDPHWDFDQVWSIKGKVFKGGLWIKKKAAILRDNSDLSAWRFENRYPDRYGVDRDLRTENVEIGMNYVWGSADPVPNITDYFFLPFIGFYRNGRLEGPMGYSAQYWSSTSVGKTPYMGNPQKYAYALKFDINSMSPTVVQEERQAGCYIHKFE